MGIWNDVTNKAWDNSQIDYAMDQMQTAGAKAPSGCTDGYCFGLAAVWIKRKWQLRDYPYDAEAYGPFVTVQPTIVMAWRAAGPAGRDGFRHVGCWRC